MSDKVRKFDLDDRKKKKGEREREREREREAVSHG